MSMKRRVYNCAVTPTDKLYLEDVRNASVVGAACYLQTRAPLGVFLSRHQALDLANQLTALAGSMGAGTGDITGTDFNTEKGV